MKISSKLNLIIVIGAILAIIAAASPFFINPSSDEAINWSRSQVTLTAIGFIGIFYAFYSTAIQLRKSMAKPTLEVTFTEDGKKEASLEIAGTGTGKYELNLWIVNKGNTITEHFQIDFDIPENFIPKIYSNVINTVESHTHNDHRIISVFNKRLFTCFVNKPVELHPLVLHIDPAKYKEYSNPLMISYKIFGDWAETQEGTLKVFINKQEVSHTPTSGKS